MSDLTTVDLAYDITGPTHVDPALSLNSTPHADTIVLLGSLGATREMWQAQVDALANDFAVIAVDLRGHGESPAPEGEYSVELLADDVVKLLDTVRVDKAHVVGLSLGGAVAQMLALKHADRLESLTLMSTAAKFGTKQAWLDKAALVKEHGTKALAETVVQNWFTEDYFRTSPQVPDTYAQGICDTQDTGYVGCCHALAEFDSRKVLAQIELPTLVMAGEQDTSTALSVVQELHHGISGSQMVTISPAKHLVNVEQPDIVNSMLRTFISSRGE
ncbi:3-oxoadipate enol-lactonase [Corynebacterium sp. H113]|uniref:3-oxoadipate enol-lactonase n=1 Tax=Corynebacterium sp. H113 TaxID=3133419 RepID=UPI00309E83B6